MKNAPHDSEISRQDFDSFFLWKVFWKLLRRECLPVFLLKTAAVAAFFIVLVLFVCLLGDLLGG